MKTRLIATAAAAAFAVTLAAPSYAGGYGDKQPPGLAKKGITLEQNRKANSGIGNGPELFEIQMGEGRVTVELDPGNSPRHNKAACDKKASLGNGQVPEDETTFFDSGMTTCN